MSPGSKCGVLLLAPWNARCPETSPSRSACNTVSAALHHYTLGSLLGDLADCRSESTRWPLPHPLGSPVSPLPLAPTAPSSRKAPAAWLTSGPFEKPRTTVPSLTGSQRSHPFYAARAPGVTPVRRSWARSQRALRVASDAAFLPRGSSTRCPVSSSIRLPASWTSGCS